MMHFLTHAIFLLLKCNVKLFADDTSLFTVIQGSDSAANDMNNDFFYHLKISKYTETTTTVKHKGKICRS